MLKSHTIINQLKPHKMKKTTRKGRGLKIANLEPTLFMDGPLCFYPIFVLTKNASVTCKRLTKTCCLVRRISDEKKMDLLTESA